MIMTMLVACVGIWFVLWIAPSNRVECYKTYPLPEGGYAKVLIDCPKSEKY